MLGSSALTAILYALALVANHVVAADAAVYHVPLQRHLLSTTSSATAHMAALHLEHFGALETSSLFAPPTADKRSRVWTPSFPSPDQKNLGEMDVEPTDFTNIGMGMYVATLSVGTPPQPISLALSLMGTDVLLLNHKLQGHKYFYDHAKSSSYRANGTEIHFNDDTPFPMEGLVSSDTLALPGSSSSSGHIQVRDLTFVELKGPDSSLKILPPHMDGAMGLGAHSAYATGTPSLMQAMIAQGLLDKPVVGIQFDAVNAHVTFGGLDPTYSEADISYFAGAIQEHGAWGVPVRSVQVDGKPVVTTSGQAIVFEGSTFIGGPRDQVEALASAVGATNFALPCDGPGPDIAISLSDSFHVTLTKKEYAINPRNGVCMFAILPMDRPSGSIMPPWMLGMPFIERVYMVLDYGTSGKPSSARLGLALAKKM